MDKKSQLAFLKLQLENFEKARLENEVNVRGLRMMNLVGKEQSRITQAIIATNAEQENLDLKIKIYKQLIQEVEDGRFTL